MQVESALQEEVEALDKKVQFFADTVTELDEAMSSEEAAAAAKIADLEAELQKHVADLQAERSTSRVAPALHCTMMQYADHKLHGHDVT